MNNRIQTSDLLKGTAVLLMIQVHIIELFATNSLSASRFGSYLLFLGGPFVAPVFLIILGYFMASSKRTTKQLILRGIMTFCLGMILNILLNLNLILSVNAGKLQIDLLPYIFGVDILQFAGIAIIALTILKSFFKKKTIPVVAIAVASAFLGTYLLQFMPDNFILKYITSFFYGSSKWAYFPLFPWLAYPLMGFVFYQLKQQYNLEKLQTTKIKIVGVVLFLLFLMFTFRYAVFVSSNLEGYYHHGLLFFLWTILFLAFYSLFVNEINTITGNFFIVKYVKWLGGNVTIVYVIQWILIGNIATEIYKTISSPLYLVISYLLILIVASCLTYLFIRMKEKFLKAF